LFYLFYFQVLIVFCSIFFQKSIQNIWSVKKNALLLHPLSRTTVLSYKASIVARLLQQRLTIKIFKIFSLKILQNQKPALSLQSVSARLVFGSPNNRITESPKNHSGDFLNEVVFFERLNIQTTKTRLRKKIATVSFLLLWKRNR
jgi:hypothetical protein